MLFNKTDLLQNYPLVTLLSQNELDEQKIALAINKRIVQSMRWSTVRTHSGTCIVTDDMDVFIARLSCMFNNIRMITIFFACRRSFVAVTAAWLLWVWDNTVYIISTSSIFSPPPFSMRLSLCSWHTISFSVLFLSYLSRRLQLWQAIIMFISMTFNIACCHFPMIRDFAICHFTHTIRLWHRLSLMESLTITEISLNATSCCDTYNLENKIVQFTRQNYNWAINHFKCMYTVALSLSRLFVRV